jgi:two-component system, LuxR family, response regulator FixJ
MSTRRQIHIVDDDKAMCESMSFLLGAAGHAVTTFDSVGAFLEALPSMAVSCVVTDIRMPGVDGLELMRRLTAGGHRFPVIMITGHGNVPLAVEAMKLGAFDFLEKPFDDDTMIAAIGAALQRTETVIQSQSESSEIAARLDGLTPREWDVLKGLVAGWPNKAIGRDLGISPRTVEIYRANVMEKMKASSLSELVRLAVRAGIT